MTTAYEQERALRIARNQRLLDELGFGQVKATLSQLSKRLNDESNEYKLLLDLSRKL